MNLCNSLFKRHINLVFLFSFLLLSGCATTSDYSDPKDPLETVNRVVYKFNDGVDSVLLKPIAKGYKAVMPAIIDQGISNFFNNLGDVSNIINNTLQFKLGQASSDLGRLTINSTIGLLGFLDVATEMNIPKHHEDFGQTLGAWGLQSGPYLVLPLIGPSTARDSLGVVVGWYTDPVPYITNIPLRNSLQATRLIDGRADLLGVTNIMDKTGLDPYDLIKEGYLQRRINLIYDGLPPESEDDIEFNFDDE